MWETGQAKLRCWYINLQEPLHRTKLGFDSMDYFLDIVISPDRSTWHWKDEDEFNEAIEMGFFSPEQAQAIRTEGERALHSFLTRYEPLYDNWGKWRPPTTWTVPRLLENWDKVD
jgi:protein associated with RNAse G/E